MGIKFQIKDLGYGIKIYLDNSNKKYNVLFASNFHGDEDCLDVIFHYMRYGYEDISISFIPIVNKEKTRENKEGENINCSFNHPNCKQTKTKTKEGEILISNINLIKKYAKDGYASLHVNKKSNKNYSHIWLQGTPSKEILRTMRVYDYNLCYNTLDDYLWHEGISITACLEYSKKDRINFTNLFLDFIKKGNYENN